MSAQTIDLNSVKRGFEKPSLEAQQVFRHLMTAMSEPGRLVDLSLAPEPPAGLYKATAAVALTLFDFETTVYLDEALRGGETEAWLRFHCNCPLTANPREAEFAVLTDNPQPLSDFNRGDARYPEQSTTVILQTEALVGGDTVTLSGPGIETTRDVGVSGLPADFWNQVIDNGADFQFGVDIILTAPETLLALPRTVRIGGQ